ncbi:MAG: sugar-binding transcriptional regulator [Christensenellales bacterium]|jgi:central glycolytic genes regulator
MNVVGIIKQLAPEYLELSRKRHTLLRSIYVMQPAGRRMLSAALKWPERQVRTESQFLKEADFIRVEAGGMWVTKAGVELLEKIEGQFDSIFGLSETARKLELALGVPKVILVPGDTEQEPAAFRALARAAAKLLREYIESDSIIAVTGGTTLAAIADEMEAVSHVPEALVVPARGSLGRELEIQATTVASIMAKHIGCKYRMLSLPDSVDHDTLLKLSKDPEISSALEKLRRADVLIYGIGRAQDMILQRSMPPGKKEQIIKDGAVAEAFGSYFDQSGKVLFNASSLWPELDELSRIPVKIGVAGGAKKAEAIIAVSRLHDNSIIVMDEGAAERILEIIPQMP